MMIETLDIVKWNLMEINSILKNDKSISDDIIDSIHQCIFQIAEVHNELCRLEIEMA